MSQQQVAKLSGNANNSSKAGGPNMKKLIAIITALIFLIPAIALAETAESKTSPPTIQKIAPKVYYYNYNIQEVQEEEGTFYQYNYVTIKGKPTKRKVLDAIEAAESTTDTTVVESVAVERSTAKTDMKANPLTTMTKAQLNTYIDNNWTNLTDSKAAFKKLVELIYDMLRRNGWE